MMQSERVVYRLSCSKLTAICNFDANVPVGAVYVKLSDVTRVVVEELSNIY
jgi:hypothetical protein